jgi:hypothetical protein
MSNALSIEEIFIKFRDQVLSHNLPIQGQDYSPIDSFYSKLIYKEQITQNQANFIIKLLEKYRNISAASGYDYADELATASWSMPFRRLDLSKKIYVEKNQAGGTEICLKFPYQLKAEFEKEIDISHPRSYKSNYWDNDNKIRRLNFYDYNLIHLYEFAVKHNFEIDETFMCAMADVEEIWQNSDDITPYCEVVKGEIELKNAAESALDWWKNNHTKRYFDDLLLAKSMGYLLRKKPENAVEKIAASRENMFWLKTNSDFFRMYKLLDAKVVVILDRTSKILSWLKQFVIDADNSGISRDIIKVCFRDNKDEIRGVNDWIKEAGVGGKIDSGKIFIFEHKPAKWIFKDPETIKIVITNNLYPHVSQSVKDWIDSCNIVVCLGDIKPSEQKGKQIVEL